MSFYLLPILAITLEVPTRHLQDIVIQRALLGRDDDGILLRLCICTHTLDARTQLLFEHT